MNHLVNVPISAIAALSPENAANLLHCLLRAECRFSGASPAALTISQNIYTPDGGIDAEINIDHAPPSECMVKAGLTGFQLKAGLSFKPWTKSAIKGELIDSKGGLNSEVLRLVQRGGRYALVCTGTDLTPKQRNDAKKWIAGVMADTGNPMDALLIEVHGASQLAAFVERYPAVAARVAPVPFDDALIFSEWQRNTHMANPFAPSKEQVDAIEQIRAGLLGDAKHIRVLGEPGLGKSRLVLEAVRHSDLASIVLYVEHGARFGQSIIFRYLLKNTSTYPMVLVIDELPEQEMANIWAHLKARCGALKVITLDHGRDQTHDAEIQRVQAPQLDDETIKGIIGQHIGNTDDLDRWVKICQGSPRVALAVAENLLANPNDLLKPPATVPIWERFLHGYERRDHQHARQVDCVTRHLALFARFGYEEPIGDEARYIANMIEAADPSITWSRFQEIILVLRARRVLQGSRTLFFVPKALHIYLWREFWQTYGQGFRFKDAFDSTPKSLRAWFMGMFKYADDDVANAVIKDILRIDGIYGEKDFLISKIGSEFLSTLAEANPSAVLKLLEASIGKWGDEELLAFTVNRQNIVSTLEKIAVWTPLTVRALGLLARLAVNETDTNCNNATGTLSGLFRIGSASAVTEAAPAERLPALLKLLRSISDKDRLLALTLNNAALGFRTANFRIIGPEHQGMKGSAKLWRPTTLGEWWDAIDLYFRTLIDETRNWPPHMRKDVTRALVDAINKQILIPPCTELSFHILELLVNDTAVDSEKLNQFFHNWPRHNTDREFAVIARRVIKMGRAFERRSLASRFQRYVIDLDWSEWNDNINELKSRKPSRARALVTALAMRINKNPQSFMQISHLFTSARPELMQPLSFFGEQLANHDVSHVFLPELLRCTLESKHSVCLAGYLNGVRKRAVDYYSETVKCLLCNPGSAWLGARLIVGAEYDHELFPIALDALEASLIAASDFSSLRYGGAPFGISNEDLRRLILILGYKQDEYVVELLNGLLRSLPFDDSSPFDSALVFETVQRAISSNGGKIHDEYEWDNLCKKLVAWDKAYVLPLLNSLFTEMGNPYRKIHTSAIESLAEYLLRLDPNGAWALLAKCFEATLPKWSGELVFWLHGGIGPLGNETEIRAPIADLPLDAIFAWIDCDPSRRASLIARAAPRTLDDVAGGRLTRELISRYSKIDGVTNGIDSVFAHYSWSGSASAYHKRRRDKFRVWLAAGFDREVMQWIETKLDCLDQRIEDAEIKEERERFE